MKIRTAKKLMHSDRFWRVPLHKMWAAWIRLGKWYKNGKRLTRFT